MEYCPYCRITKPIISFRRLLNNGETAQYKTCSECREKSNMNALRSYHKNKGFKRPKTPWNTPINKNPKEAIKPLSNIKVDSLEDFKLFQKVDGIFKTRQIDTLDLAKGFIYEMFKNNICSPDDKDDY